MNKDKTEGRMNFSFNPKYMCKILAHECNHQTVGGFNCPAGEHYRCPFGTLTICDDVTWKDWQEFFAKDGKHDVDK